MSAELEKLKFVRLLSCRNYLCSQCMDFFQILVVASPGPYPGYLALLEYVSRAHEIKICLSTMIVCPSMSQLSQNLMHRFLSIFLFFFYIFLQIFFFVFINMGPYGSENFKVTELGHMLL